MSIKVTLTTAYLPVSVGESVANVNVKPQSGYFFSEEQLKALIDDAMWCADNGMTTEEYLNTIKQTIEKL